MNQGEYAYFGSSDNQRIQRNAEANWELINPTTILNFNIY